MAALRQLLRPLKQISSGLGCARAGTRRLAVLSPAPPLPALGLQSRTFTSGTNKVAKTYTTFAPDMQARLNHGYGIQYYKNGKMVESDRIPGSMDDQSYRRIISGIHMFLMTITGSFALYQVNNE